MSPPNLPVDNENSMDTSEDDAISENFKTVQQSLGLCIECGDQPASLHCEQCADDFCEVCFQAIHKKGGRKTHVTKPLETYNANKTEVQTELKPTAIKTVTPNSPSTHVIKQVKNQNTDILKRSKYIPMRLDDEERDLLRLLEATMRVSEYTDNVDIISYSSKAKRIVTQIIDVCSILSGLVISSDYKKGQQLLGERTVKDNADFFCRVFEIARRHKIMNPEKMRDAYGKLLYMLMDANLSEVSSVLGFNCQTPILMVHDFLQQRNAIDILNDERIQVATSSDSRQKSKAIDEIAQMYSTHELSEQDIKRCLASIGDNDAFLSQSKHSCDQMISYLTTLFDPEDDRKGASLAIRAGSNGHRLTHSHSTQYYYVLQSLTLWGAVMNNMFELWYLCESDLMDTENYPYRLRDTGQGFNRLQACPRISKAMHRILNTTQNEFKHHWVGSGVIHLGDHNVPNALMFIDKYTQVPRILNPILNCLKQLPVICERDEDVAKYIKESYGGVQELVIRILADFFKGGFNGSGADNYFDAGSCIDGRLTSAWNWCSKIEKKSYYPVFLLTGFVGFDGEF
ncbi:hypothetical protein AKO1_006746 [Acrasis kona]|uniref:B box-type domain-containing protein n=1 Tax=Acrasis kona TaxID=1008807 RepID=A0AAW2ZJV5_9EUKA